MGSVYSCRRKVTNGNHKVWGGLPLILFGILFLSVGLQPVKSQDLVNLIYADSLSGGTVDGEPVRKLLGNVELAIEEMNVQGDSAIYFTAQNRIHAYNLQIDTGNEIIWADTLFHDAELDRSEFRGRVIIETENNTTFSQAIDFDHTLEVAEFLAPVRFIDDRGDLIARAGYYIQSNDIAFFEGDVQFQDETQYMEADSLYMNRRDDYYQLFNRVYVRNEEEDVTLAANYLETDSTGYRLLRDNAWMMQPSEDDTTHISARIIELQESDTLRTIGAFSDPDSLAGVEIFSRTFSARTDTLLYREDIDEFRLVSNPIAWYERTQLTGPFIRVEMENDEIHFLESYFMSVVVQEDSASGNLNQMAGDTLHTFFENGEIARIHMFNNSKIIAYDSADPTRPINAAALGETSLTFLNGEPYHLVMKNEVNGTFPEDSLETQPRLSEFRWEPERRPTLPDIRQPRHSRFPEELPFDLPPKYEAYLEQRATQYSPE